MSCQVEFGLKGLVQLFPKPGFRVRGIPALVNDVIL